MTEPSWMAHTQPDNAELPLWTRALIGDMLPDAVTPLTWSLIWEPAAAYGWRDCLIERFGFDDAEISSSHPESVASFGGFAYLNASVLRVWADRTPSLATDHIDPVLTAGPKPPPTHCSPTWNAPDSVTVGMLRQWYDWVLRSRNQRELNRAIDDVDRLLCEPFDSSAMTDVELIGAIHDLLPPCRRLFSQYLNQTLAALIGPRLVNEACIDIGQPAHTLRLLSGLGQVDPVSPTVVLWELSRLVRGSAPLQRFFAEQPDGLDSILRRSDQPDAIALIAGIDALIEEIGFRGPNEWDLSSPTWDEVPAIVIAMIGCLSRCDESFAPSRRRRHLEADRYRLTVEIAAALPPEARAMFVDVVESAVTFIRGREACRTALMRLLHRVRVIVRDVAVRANRRGDLGDPDDIWVLRGEELAYYADGGLAELRVLVEERRREFERIQEIDPPPMLWRGGDGPGDGGPDGWDPSAVEAESAADLSVMEPGDIMLGSPGSPGMAQGRARVIASMADLADFEPGEVLVLARPVLATTPIFVAAGAVITDTADTFAHAVVVARELGTPMVVGATGATHRIETGVTLNVDGLTGVVSVVADAGDDSAEASIPEDR